MATHESTSEIAQIRQRIAEEYQASVNGLTGFASGTTRHTFIEARMKRLASYHEELIDLVGAQEATHLIVQTIWTSEEMAQS